MNLRKIIGDSIITDWKKADSSPQKRKEKEITIKAKGVQLPRPKFKK